MNQNRLYQELNEEDRAGASPDKEEVTTFWSNICSKDIKHKLADWISEI